MSNPLPPPSSPDSSSPPSVYRPFSHLPLELVQTIIESTVPQHYHSTTYIQRQMSHRSLSLVSRLFRQIANPLLFTIVNFSTQNIMNSWWAEDPAGIQSRHPTELVAYSVDDIRGFEFSMIQLPSLKILALVELTPTMDLCVLTPLSSLQVLRLSDVSLENTVDAQLPSVIELQFLRVYLDDSRDRSLTLKAFPALRAFSYSDEHYNAVGTLAQVLAGLTPQLDALSLDAGMITELPEETIRAIEKFTLFDFATKNDNLLVVRNVRWISGKNARLADMLEFVANPLPQQRSSLLRLLYLPVSGDIDGVSEELETELHRLSDICCGRGVEIVKEEQPGSWPSNACISSDFWRRMKKAKAKEN